MMKISKRAACLAAAVMMCAFAAGCSDSDKKNNDNSSKTSAQTSAADTASQSADNANTEDGSADDTPAGETEYTPGEKLAKAAERFSGSYTYSTEVRYSDAPDSVSYVTQIKDGENYFTKTVEEGADGVNADTAFLLKDGTAYLIDNNFKAYNEVASDSYSPGSVVNEVIDGELERTYTHIPEDLGDYIAVEEYTYTGSTYITVFDFYFGENDSLAKYTAAYSVEGEDDVIQTVLVTLFGDSAEKTYFDDEYMSGLTDFAAMTEDERLGFCQSVCAEYGISTDEMYELNITTDDLKRISFDEFQTLFYAYAESE